MTKYLVEVVFDGQGRGAVDQPFLIVFPQDEVVWACFGPERFRLVMSRSVGEQPAMVDRDATMFAGVPERMPGPGEQLALESSQASMQFIRWRAPDLVRDPLQYRVEPVDRPGKHVSGMVFVEPLSGTAAGGSVGPPPGNQN